MISIFLYPQRHFPGAFLAFSNSSHYCSVLYYISKLQDLPLFFMLIDKYNLLVIDFVLSKYFNVIIDH